jgi:toxin ParE1/3/4
VAQIIWSEPALSDLNDIAEYIALDNFDAASHLVQEYLSVAGQLKSQPKSGHCPPEFERKSVYLEVIVGPCRIIYRVESDKVYILYVMRDERELRVFLLEERARGCS